MKSLVFLVILNCFFLNTFTQEIKIPDYIIQSQHLTKKSFQLIRWINWSEEQRMKIFNETKSFVETNSKDENNLKIEAVILSIASKEQLDSFEKKLVIKDELANKIKENLQSFNQSIEKAGGKNAPDLDTYDTMNWAKHFYFDHIWALSRTPASKEEQAKLFSFISKLKEQHDGIFGVAEISVDELNKTNNLLEIQLRKDYGTKALEENLSNILTEKNHATFKQLLALYTKQKATLHELYQEYAPSLQSSVEVRTPQFK